MPFKANADRRHHIPKQRHKVTNWAEYDAGLRARGSLTVWFTAEAIEHRDLGGEDIVRLVLDGTVVRVRLDRKATSISLLVVLSVRRDGQKVLLAIRAMGGESEAAWRAVLDDLVAHGLRTPEFLIIDGAAGLEKALAALWPAVPAQRCTVHKHRNLLAHAPERLHDEISADYTDMIYAESAKEIEGLPAGAAGGLFAAARAAGWIAHALEQRRDGRLIRPRARYVEELRRPPNGTG